MTNNKTINLLKDMLDITLNLPLFYIEDIKNNLEEIEKYLPSLLTINKDYFNNNFFINDYLLNLPNN